MRVTSGTLFTDGRSNGIAPRTVRLVLRKDAELQYAATTGNPGDVLTKVNGEELQIVDDLARALSGVAAGDKVEVEFERNGKW